MCLASGKALVCDEKRPAHRKRNSEVVLGRPGMLLYLKKSLTEMVLSCYCQSYGLCRLLEISGMLDLKVVFQPGCSPQLKPLQQAEVIHAALS